jgi:hypothetical protein
MLNSLNYDYRSYAQLIIQLLEVLSITYLILVLNLLLLQSDMIYGIELKSAESPIMKNPNLKVQLNYQGQFKVQP